MQVSLRDNQWANICEHYVVILFLFGTFSQDQAVEISGRNAQIFRLSALVGTHARIAIRGTALPGFIVR
jgi:hypothetical protein